MASPDQQPRVLVIRGGAIGDFILTMPALRLLRQNISRCHLEVLGYPDIASLAVKAGLADAVRSLEHRTMAPLFGRHAAVDESVAAYLRSFNLVVSYLYDPDGHFRASLERAGVKTLIECSHRVEPGKGHAVRQLAKPLERLAMFLDEPIDGRLFAPAAGAAVERTGLALHPGSGSTTKNWPLPNWLQLARDLRCAHPALRLAFITGEAEAERGMAAGVRDAAAALQAEHWHGLPLVDLADRLMGTHGFIGHDSGISHLAAACGAACVVLFGPTDPATWAPASATTRIVAAPEGDWQRLEHPVVLQHAMALVETPA